MVDESMVVTRGTAELIQRERPEIEKIRNIIISVIVAFKNKESTRLGKIARELNDLLKSIDGLEPDVVIKRVKETEEEIARTDPQEAAKIKKETAKIIRNEDEKRFLRSVLSGLGGADRDKAFEFLLKNFDAYIKRIEEVYKDKRTADDMRKKRDEARKRTEKGYLENKEKDIETWNPEMEIKECIRQLDELRKKAHTEFKDTKLYDTLMREGKRGDTANKITRLLFYEAERTYITRLIDGITHDDAKWTFFLKEFYKNEVENNMIVKRVRKFEDHWAADQLIQRKKVGEDRNAWIDILSKIQRRLEGEYRKKVIAEAKDELTSLLKRWITTLAEDSAKMINELTKAFEERIRTLEKEKIPAELKKIIQDLNKELAEQERESIRLIRETNILGMIKQSNSIEFSPKTESDMEKLRRESEEINSGLDQQGRIFAFMLNVFAYIRRDNNVTMQHVDALKKGFSGLLIQSGKINIVSKEHNEAAEEMQKSMDEKLKLYSMIRAEFGRISGQLGEIIKRTGIVMPQQRGLPRPG